MTIEVNYFVSPEHFKEVEGAVDDDRGTLKVTLRRFGVAINYIKVNDIVEKFIHDEGVFMESEVSKDHQPCILITKRSEIRDIINYDVRN